MKRYAIHHIPLIFLFLPTLLAATGIYLFFNQQLQNRFDQQVDNHSRHVLQQVAQLAHEPLFHRRVGELKQALWSFAQKAQSGIENIVIYDATGELVTALNLDEQLVDSRLELPDRLQVYGKNGLYHAVSPVDVWLSEPDAVDIGEASGFVLVSFSSESFNLDMQRNMLVVIAITLVALLIGAGLWRYRYMHFNRQMSMVNDALVNLNKGYKHVKLPGVKGYRELNVLQQQLNALVGFFEKRLTMKQFEVTALEQTLNQSNEKHEQLNKQIEQLKNQLEKSQQQTSTLAADMYRVCYQSLQATLANVENALEGDEQDSQAHCDDGEVSSLTESINHLNQMLNELKVLCDVIQGQGRAHLDFVTPGQLIASVGLMVKPLTQAKGLEFIVNRPLQNVEIEVDANQLQKVLFALLQSAVAATDKGYIKLTLDVAELEKADESGNTHSLRCEVLDTGCGLTQPRFELLSKDVVSNELADDQWVIWGLNLMVAKKTIESMLGRFKVKSLSGLGAQFTLELPCRAKFETLEDTESFIGSRVLLFDSVLQSAEYISDALSEFGIEVVHCRNSQALSEVGHIQHFTCAIISRPDTLEGQQDFDTAINMLRRSAKLEKGLQHAIVLRDTLDWSLDKMPSGWQLSEKPFHFADFAQYCRPILQKLPESKTMSSPLADNQIEILAVDDNETNLKLLSVVLRQYPVKLVSALSGQEALEFCRRQRFDVILMDKEMPNMDGMEACEHIRKLTLHQQTPLVMFSAHLDEEEKRTMLNRQISDCMVKPLDHDKFIYLMENWCQQRWQHISEQNA